MASRVSGSSRCCAAPIGTTCGISPSRSASRATTTQSYTDGDNSDVLPTDTMKNTVYALAAQEPVGDPEIFGIRLARHFLARNRRLTRVAHRSVPSISGTGSPPATAQHGARLRAAAARTPARPSSRRRATARRSRRASRPGDHEIRGVGVRRLPARRIHDAARDARSAAGHGADRDVAVPRHRRRLHQHVDGGAGQRCSRCSPGISSESVQHTLYAMGQAVLDTILAGRGHPPDHAQQTPPAGRPVAVRPGEPQRDLRGDRGTARLDRGDDRAVAGGTVL